MKEGTAHVQFIRAKHAIGQSIINQKGLLSSKVPPPSIKQQQALIHRAENFLPCADALAEERSEQRAVSIGLRESILRKAFAGEL
jgi:hypothetical protein